MKSHTATKKSSRLALTVVSSLFFGICPLSAADTLQDMATEGGVDWIVGEWTSVSEGDRKISVEYEWELDGCALEIELEMGERSYEGLIMLNPKSGDVVEYGASNDGGMTQATWSEEDGSLVSKRIGTRPDGEVRRMAIINKKVDENTMTSAMHPLSEDGEISEEPIHTVTLKRVTEDEDDD